MFMFAGQHVIIYNDEDIHYITGDVLVEHIEPVIEESHYLGDSIQQKPINRTFTFTIENSFETDTIKLDETMMKRIAKYNKEKELQKIEEQIKEKEKQIKELDNKLQDKEKRWQKVKDYIANIYDLDLEEDDDDDYYFD